MLAPYFYLNITFEQEVHSGINGSKKGWRIGRGTVVNDGWYKVDQDEVEAQR